MGRRPTPKDDLYDLKYQEDYYLRHQRPDPDSDCIVWHGPKHVQGYGMIGAWRSEDGHKIMTTTHRIAARRKFGRELPSSEFVIHTCGNPACVNEDHIETGDMFAVRANMKKALSGL